MTKPKLTYFDAPVSRGEECRLALHAAGVDFEDNRIKREAWPALKPTTPFGSLPTFEIAGRPVLAQTNAILTLIGREHGLHPKDPYEAALHEAILAYAEELRNAIGRTMHNITDEEEKKKARETLCASYFPVWGANVEKQIGEGPFFAGAQMNVVDIKLFALVRWVSGGALDHIPASTFAPFPKLTRLHDAVRDDARIKAWYARS